MGEEDVKRQALNVFRMELLGAKVHAVTDGSRVLKDAVNAALRAWVAQVEDTHYVMGSVLGPAPFPEIVRDFQSVIGKEAKRQFAEISGGQLPDALLACIGGGSNAMGLFYPFVDDTSVAMYGVEAAGLGLETDFHAATSVSSSPRRCAARANSSPSAARCAVATETKRNGCSPRWSGARKASCAARRRCSGVGAGASICFGPTE